MKKKVPLPLFLGVKAEWIKKDGNAEPCKKCDEPIYGNRYEHETTVFMKTEITGGPLCESCYTVTINPEA